MQLPERLEHRRPQVHGKDNLTVLSFDRMDQHKYTLLQGQVTMVSALQYRPVITNHFLRSQNEKRVESWQHWKRDIHFSFCPAISTVLSNVHSL